MSSVQARKILIDWGTTNVRAFLVDSEGNVLERRDSGKGIKYVEEGQFPEVFESLVNRWDNVACTLMAGMIGSANGWQETPYTPLPVSIKEMKKGIYSLASMKNVYIVGGLSYRNSDEIYDVIRGEEVQIVGFLEEMHSQEDAEKRHLICLPGTHSKWLAIRGDTIISFSTVMSGDFFAAVCSKTIMSLMLKTRQIFQVMHFYVAFRCLLRPVA